MRSAAVALILCIICATALDLGLRATQGLEWPGGSDFARDIASAESIARGHPLSDPYYRGEWNWYNPLAPAIVAGISLLIGQPIPFVYAHIGAYAGLSIPLTLFALAMVWWDSLSALVAVIAVVFLVPGPEPGWLSASYSPWMLPMHLGQAAFYAGMLAVTWAVRTEKTTAYAVAGAAIGLTLLTHTAPTLLLAAALVFEYVHREWTGPIDGRARRLVNMTVAVLVAIVVASPYLVSIGGHYHFHIVNAAPITFLPDELTIARAPDFWLANRPSLIGGLALVGIAWLWRSRHTLPSRLALTWAVVSLACLVISYVAQTALAQRLGFHGVVPGHHFLYYLRAFIAVAFAQGIVCLASWRRVGGRRVAMPIAVAIVIAAAVWHYPAYTNHFDFVGERIIAQRMFADKVLLRMYGWFREHTSPDDVVLASPNLAQSVIGTAGRHVVVVDKLFSNPYVDWAARDRDRKEMDRLLAAHEWTGFLDLAARYRVRYVARPEELSGLEERTPLTMAWHEGVWFVYAVGPTPR
jgi:hypothetical protein